MKRLLTALLAILYLTLSSGATVHAHYCMGQLIGTSLSHAASGHNSEHSCELCGMKKGSNNGGCCHDEEASFKASEAQKGDVIQMVPAVLLAEAAVPCVYAIPVPPVGFREVASKLWANGPPLRPPAVPIFLRVCNFRI